jgi:hypothetical protein
MDGEVRYGSAAAVPSRLEEPPDAPWTVIVLASEAPERVSRLLAGLRTHAPRRHAGRGRGQRPERAQQAALAAGAPDRAAIGGREIEVLRTATRLGHAAALNIALRRVGRRTRAAGRRFGLADRRRARLRWPKR